MTDPVFARYQTDHLLLLLGTNPLPNYVAAQLLARPDTRVHLVVTQEIMQAGAHKTLLELLGRYPQDDELCLEVPSSDPVLIFDRVRQRVAKTPGTWGLHYTGGKKSMVTHAYRAVESALKERQAHGTFSYLDADTLEMVIESPLSPNAQRLKANLTVDVSIAQMLQMYQHPLSTSPNTSPFQPEICRKIVVFCQDSTQRQTWSRWTASLRDKSREFKEAYAASIEIGPELQALLGGSTLGELAPAWGSVRKAGQIAKWLHGPWLEHYVLDVIKRLPSDLHINDIGQSISPKGIATFEVDVVAMQGYRMFAFSVTTDVSDLNKLKLFEAVERAQQMGGDEAHVALVTFSEKAAQLQRQVAEVWGDRHRSRIRVFGLSQLPNLDQHLEAWFKEN